jgi:phage major head subunit gpT-like protein
MLINRSTLSALFKTVVSGFQTGMEQKPPVDLSFLVSPFTSVTASNYYPWLEAIPGFREWVGDRVFHNLRGQRFEVANRDFELSIGMPAKDIEDDTYGIITGQGGLVPLTAAQWPMELYDLIIEVLTNQVLAWDGKAMLANDHAYGDNTIDNLVTDALSSTSFEAALLAASAWKFSNDKLCRPKFTHLLHGPKLAGTVADLIENQYVISGAAVAGTVTDFVGGAISNRNYKKVIPVEIPDFAGTYDDHWRLVDASGILKPVLQQLRKTPQVTMTTDPERVAEQGKVNIMADGRAAAAPTFFHLIYGGVL